MAPQVTPAEDERALILGVDEGRLASLMREYACPGDPAVGLTGVWMSGEPQDIKGCEGKVSSRFLSVLQGVQEHMACLAGVEPRPQPGCQDERFEAEYKQLASRNDGCIRGGDFPGSRDAVLKLMQLLAESAGHFQSEAEATRRYFLLESQRRIQAELAEDVLTARVQQELDLTDTLLGENSAVEQALDTEFQDRAGTLGREVASTSARLEAATTREEEVAQETARLREQLRALTNEQAEIAEEKHRLSAQLAGLDAARDQLTAKFQVLKHSSEMLQLDLNKHWNLVDATFRNCRDRIHEVLAAGRRGCTLANESYVMSLQSAWSALCKSWSICQDSVDVAAANVCEVKEHMRSARANELVCQRRGLQDQAERHGRHVRDHRNQIELDVERIQVWTEQQAVIAEQLGLVKERLGEVSVAVQDHRTYYRRFAQAQEAKWGEMIESMCQTRNLFAAPAPNGPSQGGEDQPHTSAELEV